ncbi:Peptidoglycan/xylan/chitin deacetylase, PgdA/CDA1 family [Duganella sp. CF517]|uniref:polysaccharide deacetylase family protein n=1 Tax=Duganella sp. CF517 TaxID=1881038 RepID=UPI0008BF67D1|nr:polysaccharide deacetylase family protein [Duganella sp. CF517]SEO53184.1 Peptidoglycan/xylan/chitin deacetylase, PgdA/CDA1 family [Duganella sp. CF517]
MTIRIISALAAAAFLAQPAAQAQGAGQAAFRWPDGARAAVSLSYDDSLDSQLDTALPTLDKYGLKASFYLELSGQSVGRRMAAWRAAAVRGHELGNHSLFHQCSGSLPGHQWVRPERDLDTLSVAQMAAQVRLGNTMLAAIDGRRERTYTVPCGDTMALAPGGRASYLPAIAGEFVAMKTAGGQAVTPSMGGLDPYAVTVLAPEGLSGKQLIALVREAGERGTMVNFTFHGVGGDYLVTSAEAHEELVRYLAENRKTYWTDTFLNIMTYVKKQK